MLWGITVQICLSHSLSLSCFGIYMFGNILPRGRDQFVSQQTHRTSFCGRRHYDQHLISVFKQSLRCLNICLLCCCCCFYFIQTIIYHMDGWEWLSCLVFVSQLVLVALGYLYSLRAFGLGNILTVSCLPGQPFILIASMDYLFSFLFFAFLIVLIMVLVVVVVVCCCNCAASSLFVSNTYPLIFFSWFSSYVCFNILFFYMFVQKFIHKNISSFCFFSGLLLWSTGQ